MRKAIIAITGVAFLSVAASLPAQAFAPIFFVPYLLTHKDPNFKAVNPYAKTVVHKHAKKKKK